MKLGISTQFFIRDWKRLCIYRRLLHYKTVRKAVRTMLQDVASECGVTLLFGPDGVRFCPPPAFDYKIRSEDPGSTIHLITPYVVTSPTFKSSPLNRR